MVSKMTTFYIILLLISTIQRSNEVCTKTTSECRRYIDRQWNNYGNYEQECEHPLTSTVICEQESTFEKIAPYLSEDVTNFEIQNSNISTIPINTFHEFSTAHSLTIRNSSVQSLELGSFNGLHFLKTLKLTENNISRISSRIFNHLLELDNLDLSRNEIKYVDIESFVGIKNLVRVNASNNKLESISALIVDCHLQVLDVSHNKLKNIESLKNCTFLKELYLRDNEIHNISNSNEQFRTLQLEHLDLSSNNLEYLAVDTFESLKEITYLDLSDNLLSKTNNGQLMIGTFQHLSHLRVLKLSSNGFTNFPLGTFSRLSVLTSLDISNNALSSLPKNIFHDLISLSFLNISNNQLSEFESPNLRLSEIIINNNWWFCDEVAKIIKTYPSAVIKGTNNNATNIFGISCTQVGSHRKFNETLNRNDDKYYEYLVKSIVEQNQNFQTKLQRDVTKQSEDVLEKMLKGYINQTENFLEKLRKDNKVQNENFLEKMTKDYTEQNRNFFNDVLKKYQMSKINDSVEKILEQNERFMKSFHENQEHTNDKNMDSFRELSVQIQNFSIYLNNTANVVQGTFFENLASLLKEIFHVKRYFVNQPNNESETNSLKSNSIINDNLKMIDNDNLKVQHDPNSIISVSIFVVLVLIFLAFVFISFYITRFLKFQRRINKIEEIHL